MTWTHWRTIEARLRAEPPPYVFHSLPTQKRPAEPMQAPVSRSEIVSRLFAHLPVVRRP